MVRLVVHVSYSGFVTDIGNKISDAGEKAWNAVEETYNNAKREVEEFASDVKQGVDDFVSDVKQEVDEFVDNVQQGAEELVDEITEFVEDTKEAAEEFMEETKEKLEVTGQAIAETVKGMSPMELAHTTLDMVGMIPVAGEFCDAANALLYLAEKDYGNAAMSAAACIPGWGNAATGAKWIGKGANAVDAIADTAKALDKAMDTVEAISDGTRVASNIADVSGAIVDGSKAVGNVAGNIPTLELPKGNFAKELYEGLLGFVSLPFVKLGDNIDTAADTAKAMDKLNDAEKAGDVLDAVGDVSKKTGDVADTAGDVAKKADTTPAKSNGADDAVENANDATKPKETLEEVGEIEDNGDAYEYYMDLVEELDVSTAPNTATFYSGQGNRQLAEEFARNNGKMTLETTQGGAFLDGLELFGESSPLTKEEATNVWARLSARYAQNASGNVYGFVNGSWMGSIFNTVEYPELLKNSNVSNIFTEFMK